MPIIKLSGYRYPYKAGIQWPTSPLVDTKNGLSTSILLELFCAGEAGLVGNWEVSDKTNIEKLRELTRV